MAFLDDYDESDAYDNDLTYGANDYDEWEDRQVFLDREHEDDCEELFDYQCCDDPDEWADPDYYGES